MSGRRQRWLYLIGSDEVRPVKIGVSFNPDKRLEELQVGSPVILRMLWKAPGGRDMERALHACFRSYWKHGEWFDFGDENPVAIVAGTAALLGYWRLPDAVATLLPPVPWVDRGFINRLIANTPPRYPERPTRKAKQEPSEPLEIPRVVLPSFDALPARETEQGPGEPFEIPRIVLPSFDAPPSEAPIDRDGEEMP
ncbi:GIY-YIG nuclease family protein [Planobispora rosea]|uniref:GIY-YIG nuclease family protein n=1 Tax=Planobispora rosea TaxID=35762 RepID=UPI00114CAF71|nr:GIY-YIG nuclease family protein [Planobispora rosea]